MKNSFLGFILCFLALSPLLAQTDESGWVLEHESDGIQIFSRPQGENQVHEFKGIARMTGNIDSAFRVLSDWPAFSKTDPMVLQTEIFERLNANQYYIWDLVDMPLFLASRDIVSKVTLSRTSKGGYMIVAQSDPQYIPEKPKLVRVQDFMVVVSLQPLDHSSFELLYKVRVGDTESNLVRNAANKGLVPSTFERMKRVRDMVAVRPLAGQ